MKKIITIALVAVALVLSQDSKAQDLSSIAPAAGLELSLPLGDFGDVYNPGFGVFAKGVYAVNEQFGATARLGLNRWGGSSAILGDDYKASLRDIQLQAGGRYAINNLDEGLYGAASLGLHFIKLKAEVPNIASLFNNEAPETTEVENSEVAIGLSIGGGYMINNIDLFARFQVLSIDGNGFHQFNLGAAYFF